MRTVHKYEVAIDEHPTRVEMPRGARIVHAGQQQNPREVVLWAIVDTSAPFLEDRCFLVTGTGHPLPRVVPEYPRVDEPVGTPSPELEHRGTVQAQSGLVWHVWEQPKRTKLA